MLVYRQTSYRIFGSEKLKRFSSPNLKYMNTIQSSIALFNNAQPGSIERIKALLAINPSEINEDSAALVAEVVMQIRYSNNEVDHKIIMQGLYARSESSEDGNETAENELVKLYGDNPWNATNSLLSSWIRPHLVQRAKQEHGDDWYISFVQYES